MYFTGQPSSALKGPLGSCCSGCASGKDTCGGHKATGDFSTNTIGIIAIVGIAWLAMSTMKKAAR